MALALALTFTPHDFASLYPSTTRNLSLINLSISPKSRRNRRVRSGSSAAVGEREAAPVENGAATARSRSGESGAYLGGNGSVGKYLKENGAVVVEKKDKEVRKVKEEEKVEVVMRERKKKSVEEIGQEEAWFKRDGRDRVEVSVAPGGRWSRFKTYSTIQRTLEIWGFVLTLVFKVWLNNQKFSYRGGMTEEKKVQKRKALAKWLKEGILRLGPTFIKIGQQFSTRVDILAQEYVDQLSELQDQVPPFPSQTAVSIVEEELGAPVGEIFDRFDYEPIAAASLGQVHRARLKGQEVAVKVQRPGLKDLFDIDLKNLRVIAEYLQKIDPKSDGAKRDWVAIYDECASVLTMEYVPGIKINRIQALDQLGVDRQRLGRYAVESYLEQILSHGFFHADPHPGNIAVDDVNGGRLIFYDFGMMGSISPNIREGLLEVLQAMIKMGVLVPTGDMTAVRRTAQFFLNSFEERLAAQKREGDVAGPGLRRRLSKEERVQKKKQRLAAIGEDLLSIAADQPFRFPATFTFVVRAFSVLDGIGKGLDPRFDISEIAKPYALELLRFREVGVEVIIKDFRRRWDRQSRAFYNLFRQADRMEKLSQIMERLEKGDLKLRVRTLESERAFQRVAAVQKTIGNIVAAGTLINLATILHLHSVRVPAIGAYILSAFFGLQVLFGLLKDQAFAPQNLALVELQSDGTASIRVYHLVCSRNRWRTCSTVIFIDCDIEPHPYT
ncbi:ACTIVITY OF BC1 COMPLEX KINASE 8, chloroplastic-like protein [Drosera capensis]